MELIDMQGELLYFRRVQRSLQAGVSAGSLTLKLATSKEEVDEALRLRYKVFNQELEEGLPESHATGMDRDLFDDYCDHLLVLNEDRKVVGTYRLLHGPKRPPQGFYTETEFDFSKLSFDKDQTIELGRACIDPQHRKRATLMTLFWGLHLYAQEKKARYLLGCGSLPQMSNDDAEATFKALRHQDRVDETTGVSVLPSHSFKGDADEGEAQIAPLVTLYLEFGAKILGRPAYDAVFKCFDLLVFFDMQNLSGWGNALLEKFDRRYNG
jgi:putative hemolysin